MSLPHSKNTPTSPLTPIWESLFEVQANLPESFLKNITTYDLDVVNKRVTFTVQLNEEMLGELSLFSTESIRILHHNTDGKVLIQTDLETITNTSFMSLTASYGSDDLLMGRFAFQFGTIYQQIFDPHKYVI